MDTLKSAPLLFLWFVFCIFRVVLTRYCVRRKGCGLGVRGEVKLEKRA